MKQISTTLVLFAAAAVLLLSGCSSSKNAENEQPKLTAAEQQVRDARKSIAIQRFIDGSVAETKGDYAQAIIEYQDALRYDDNPAIYYAIAKDYFTLGKAALASDMVEEAIQRDPENTTYHQLLAEVFVSTAQFDSALAEYRRILSLDSTNVNSMYSIARLTQQTRPLQALEMYEKIIRLNGPDWQVLAQMADINTALHRFREAAEVYKKMADLDPSNLALQQSLADAYVRAGEYDTAMTMYQRLLAMDSSRVEVRSALAELYLQKNDWKNARDQFDIIQKSDSLSADIMLRIAVAYFSQTQKDSSLVPEARRRFENILGQYPGDWRPMFYLGIMDLIANHDSSAMTRFDGVTTRAGWNADAWWYLGLAYSRLHRNEDAVAALQHAVTLNPKHLNALSALGSTYDTMKRYKESDSAYEAALKIDSHDALVLNNYAYSLAERGEQLERALKMSKESLEKDSANAAYLDTYGWIFFRLGKYEEARLYINEAVESGQASPVVFEHLGDVYFKLNDAERAKEYWEKALKKDPSNSSLKEKLARGAL
ncbi:MAG: tetratricopeptide repeat protein [Bacteroidota bacterium]|nr:tetratricopeptide repeat protein [Bacteroidota bacterium]